MILLISSVVLFTACEEEGESMDEIRVDLREFIEKTMLTYYDPAITGVSLAIDIKDPGEMIAEKISGRAFEIDNVDFALIFSDGIQTETLPHDFSARGTFDKGKINLQFVMTTPFGGLLTTYEGIATGEKE